MATGDLTGRTVELLQALIRNACVNDGTPESGQEVRNADLLQSYLEGSGLAIQRYEPTPGRTSLVARIEGTDPSAPSLCLMGHTDVVPVSPDGWSRDPRAEEHTSELQSRTNHVCRLLLEKKKLALIACFSISCGHDLSTVGGW